MNPEEERRKEKGSSISQLPAFSLVMTTGETEETCGGQKKAEGRIGGGEGSMKLSLSFTTLSTIAIQAGQSQIVISVLKVCKETKKHSASISVNHQSITRPPALHLN